MSGNEDDDRQAAGQGARAGMSGRCATSTQGCHRLARITSVEFLDGPDDALVSGNTLQFVNLARSAAMVDEDGATNQDRMSRRPRCKVTFSEPGVHSFTLKLLTRGSNLRYTQAEKARNSNFLYQWRDCSFTTDQDGTKIVDAMYLTAAGKSKYRIRATDVHGNRVQTSELEAKRFLYYVTLPMRGVQRASSLGAFRRELRRHDIVAKGLQRYTMPHMPNVGPGAETRRLERLARRTYDRSLGPSKAPYTMAVVFTDQLAAKHANCRFTTGAVSVGPERGHPVRFGMRYSSLLDSSSVGDRYLWKDVVPGESWFVSAKFFPADGGDPVDIPEDKCTAVPASDLPEASKQVDIDVSGLSAGQGVVELRVNLVDRFRGGVALGGEGSNLIVICTRAFWRDSGTARQNQVLIHEVGHKFDMAADGQAGPDRTANQYTGHQHLGSHCCTGLSTAQKAGSNYTLSSLVAASSCVMYGSTNGQNRFCSSCTPAVRKQDLGSGWPAF